MGFLLHDPDPSRPIDKSCYNNTEKYVDLLTPTLPTPLEPLVDTITKGAGVRLFIKRDDLIHPQVSGNKWRKLKYNLIEAGQNGVSTILTFGGARSNHLYATAAAGNALGIKTIGVVRGEEYNQKYTDTLLFCKQQGMQLIGISREEYRQRNDYEFIQHLKNEHGNPLVIPEGGTTRLSLPGVAEMVYETTIQLNGKPDYYAVAAGTGGTAAGILKTGATVLAFSALKGGSFLEDEILTLVNEPWGQEKLRLFTEYHHGRYARHTPELLQFMQSFEQEHRLLLEHVYTGKMLFGLYDLMKKGYFSKGSSIVAVHTGGLQGRSHDQ
jgi:1-aminocyclopropane-1-carboxylate deaminase/D-cysteine desulfhydrase-like pyridoxal-dependent ACC family enzyme